MGRFLIITGIILVLIGVVVSFAGKIPFLGKLPGDIVLKKGDITFYFPLVTGIVISIIATIIINIFLRFFR